MTSYTDFERLSLGAEWADEAHQQLGDELHQACGGRMPATVTMSLDTMEALHDGLHVLAETLHAMCLPYPPPPVPPKRNDHLKLVE